MSETLSSQQPECVLTVTLAQPTPQSLTLHYHLRSQSPEVLYLCNLLYEVRRASDPQQYPFLEIDPNKVHVQVMEQGVVVDKAIMNLSFHNGISGPDIPCVTRLEPGAAYEETLELSLPLVPYRAYDSRPAEQPPVPLPLTFHLGYFVSNPQMETEMELRDTSIGKAYDIPFTMNRQQRVITAGPFLQPVLVANAIGNGVKPSDEPWTPWG